MNVREVIEKVLDEVYGKERLEKTGDTLICGDYNMEVSGVATTFMATVDVIQQAVAEGANMIITHEPTFFNAEDQTDWLKDDPLYQEKKKMIEENQLAVWRFHDYMHAVEPDKIYEGLLKEIGWESKKKYPDSSFIYELEDVSLKDLAVFFKEKLSMDVIQIIGNPEMTCSKAGILVGGASLGLGREQMPIELMQREELDVMICGEIVEWTLSAYVNDAAQMGLNKGMIVIGHERSEEWGMKYMQDWLAPLIEPMPVTFIDAKEPFAYI